jgi:hypothetical protein
MQAIDLNIRVHELPPSTSFDHVYMGSLFLHDTLNLKDINLEQAWVWCQLNAFLLV